MSLAETIIILLVALLAFGPKELPVFASRLGRALARFKHWQQLVDNSLDEQLKQAQLEINLEKAEAAESHETPPKNKPQ